MENAKQVKILIRYESPVLDKITVETLWATVIDNALGLYKLDNIPFYGPQLACGDIVFAEYDPAEEMLTYRHTVEYSGNSVVLVVLMDKVTDVELTRGEFKKLGCESESTGTRYFAMEIPSELDYTPIKKVLTDYFKKGILDYSEPCLSDKHSQRS